MRLRAALYPAGIAALVAAFVLPADSIEDHIVSHALVAVVAAPLLVLAAPPGALLAVVPRSRRPAALALAQRRPLSWLLGPVVAWSAFVAAHWVALLVAGDGHVHGLAHLGLHALLLVTGLLFWAQVLGAGPVPRPLGGGAAGLYLFLAMPAADLTAVWLMARGDTGAVGLMLAAMLPLGIAAVAVSWSWIVREERLARAGEAAR